MNDDWRKSFGEALGIQPINPKPFCELQVHSWIHPAYAVRKMEYILPNGNKLFCPLLRREAKYISWRLDDDLKMIPESLKIG